MPCVVCREVVVGAVCATVHATDDYLRRASSHCARTPATANGDLARPPDPTLAQPKPAQWGVGLSFELEASPQLHRHGPVVVHCHIGLSLYIELRLLVPEQVCTLAAAIARSRLWICK